MASSLFHLILLFTAFSFLSLSSSLPHRTILNAAGVLSDSGYVSMSLTLPAVSQTLLAQSPSVTIFAPSDSAFRRVGQPCFDLLRYHFSPLPLLSLSLRSLPADSKIPTMFASHSLTVTSSQFDDTISLNNVRITATPIYADGFFIIYGIDRFFDPNFQATVPFQIPNPNPVCVIKNQTFGSSYSFGRASGILKSGAYSLFASFLGMQIYGITEHDAVTVFAAPDEMVLNRVGNLRDYPSFFLSHVVPCKIEWNGLVNFNYGSELPTFLEGFSLNITRTNGVLLLNGVPVFFPDIFDSDKLVIHGVRDALSGYDLKPQEVPDSISCMAAQEDDFDLVNFVAPKLAPVFLSAFVC